MPDFFPSQYLPPTNNAIQLIVRLHTFTKAFFQTTEASLAIPARAPAQPLPPKVANRGKNSLTLRWNAPQDNGASITSYELEWDQCRGAWQQLACDKAKQFKLTQKLPPASVAQFRVRASNSVGDR